LNVLADKHQIGRLPRGKTRFEVSAHAAHNVLNAAEPLRLQKARSDGTAITAPANYRQPRILPEAARTPRQARERNVKRSVNVSRIPFAGSAYIQHLRRFAAFQHKVQFLDTQLRKLSCPCE